MRNLYEILGLSSNATAIQIEQAYRVRLHALKDKQSLISETQDLELRAVEEAYSTLSSSSRRERYDQKLKTLNQPIRYEVVESRIPAWAKIFLILAIPILGGTYLYNDQQNKARIEQLKIEEAKAKAAAEEAERLAEAEKARVAQEKLRAQREAEENSRREMAHARYLGERAHAETERVEESHRRAIELEERQARYAQLREEQANRYRNQQQNAALERSLNRPVGGYYSRPNVVVIPNGSASSREDTGTTYNRYPR